MWWPCFGHPELATSHPRPTLPRAVRATTPPTCFQCSGNEIRRCRINMKTCFDERKNCAHVFLGNKETYEHQSSTSGSRKNTRGKRSLGLREEARITQAPPLGVSPFPTVLYIGLKEEHEGGAVAGAEGGSSDNTSPSLGFSPPPQSSTTGSRVMVRGCSPHSGGSPCPRASTEGLASLLSPTTTSPFPPPSDCRTSKWATLPRPMSNFSLISGL